MKLFTGPQIVHLWVVRVPDMLHDPDGNPGAKWSRGCDLHLPLARLRWLRLGRILHQPPGTNVIKLFSTSQSVQPVACTIKVVIVNLQW